MTTIIDGALSRISTLPSPSESELTSAVTVLSNDDQTETSQSTTNQQDKDFSFDQDTLTSEMTNVTWTDLVEGKASETNETPAAITQNTAEEIPVASPSTDGTTLRSSHESDAVGSQMFSSLVRIGVFICYFRIL